MIDIDALKRDKRPQSAWVVHALIDRLEAAEKELAELRSSMKFRTSLIGRTEAERDALRAKAAEMEQAPARLVTPTAYRWRYRGAIKWQYGELTALRPIQRDRHDGRHAPAHTRACDVPDHCARQQHGG